MNSLRQSEVAIQNIRSYLRKLSTVSDYDLLRGRARLASIRFDRLDDVHAFNDASKHSVFTVEPRSGDRTDKELRSICVGSSIGHRQHSRLRVLQTEILISKFLSIDRLSSGPISTSEVTTLNNKTTCDSDSQPRKYVSQLSQKTLNYYRRIHATHHKVTTMIPKNQLHPLTWHIKSLITR